MTKMKIIVITPNADEDTEKLYPSYFADGNVKQYLILENNFAVSYKTKHATTM